MRLRDLAAGDLTYRELASYVHGLSPHAATRAAIAGRPEPTGEQVLLADCFDMLQHIDWHVQATNVSKKSELPKKPKPYPRWWQDKQRRAKRHSPQRATRIADARKRAAARQRAIAEGRIA